MEGSAEPSKSTFYWLSPEWGPCGSPGNSSVTGLWTSSRVLDVSMRRSHGVGCHMRPCSCWPPAGAPFPLSDAHPAIFRRCSLKWCPSLSLSLASFKMCSAPNPTYSSTPRSVRGTAQMIDEMTQCHAMWPQVLEPRSAPPGTSRVNDGRPLRTSVSSSLQLRCKLLRIFEYILWSIK